jgi:hypothetical protein
MRVGKFQRNGFVWAAVLCLTVVLCDLDHARPIADSTEHGHAASPVCIFDLCVALASSKDASSSVKAVGLLLLLFSIATVGGFNRRMILEVQTSNPLAFRINRPPQAFIKLYQLHSAYLI